MSTNPNELSSQDIIKAHKSTVNRSVRSLVLAMEQENTLIAETPVVKFQKVLKIYRSIKPVLSVLSTLPLIPTTWRGAVLMFIQALDALTNVGGEITASFKAGKDLAEVTE
jgi:hypothetical protein